MVRTATSRNAPRVWTRTRGTARHRLATRMAHVAVAEFSRRTRCACRGVTNHGQLVAASPLAWLACRTVVLVSVSFRANHAIWACCRKCVAFNSESAASRSYQQQKHQGAHRSGGTHVDCSAYRERSCGSQVSWLCDRSTTVELSDSSRSNPCGTDRSPQWANDSEPLMLCTPANSPAGTVSSRGQ